MDPKLAIATKVVRPGKETLHPSDTDWVRIKFSEWERATGNLLACNQEKDSQAKALRRTEVDPGVWRGVELMVVGEQRCLWIPKRLTKLGSRDVVTDVELLEIIPAASSRAPGRRGPPVNVESSAERWHAPGFDLPLTGGRADTTP